MSIYLVVEPVTGVLRGAIPVAPESAPVKTALILGALAGGTTSVHTPGIVHSPEVEDTVQVLEQFGVHIDSHPRGYVVQGSTGDVSRAAYRIDLGRSRWQIPLLLGMTSRLSGHPITFEPIPGIAEEDIATARGLMDQLGLPYAFDADYKALQVTPASLYGGTIRIPSSLQPWAASLLAVAPLAGEPVTIEIEPAARRGSIVRVDRMLRAFGIFLDQDDDAGWWRVKAPQRYRSGSVDIGPDGEQAAFLLALAAMHPGSVQLTQLGNYATHPILGPVLEILRGMRVPLVDAPGSVMLTQSHPHVAAGRFDISRIPRLLPVLAVVAAKARGTTVFDGVWPEFLQQESLRSTYEALTLMGAEIEVRPTGWAIHGTGRLQGGVVAIPHDSMEFMAMVLAGTMTELPVSITPPWTYLARNPRFFDILGRLGIGTELRAISGGTVALP